MTKLVTAEVLAIWLGVKPRTVRDWAREGKIPSLRISPKVLRFDPDDVLRTLRDDAEQAGDATDGND